MVVSVTLKVVPPFVRLSCWRKQFIGLLAVGHPSEADIVQVELTGHPGMQFEMTENGRAQFWAVMDALAIAHEIGRRDVINSVRDIFHCPRAA